MGLLLEWGSHEVGLTCKQHKYPLFGRIGREQGSGGKGADKFVNGRQVRNLRGVTHDCFIR